MADKKSCEQILNLSKDYDESELNFKFCKKIDKLIFGYEEIINNNYKIIDILDPTIIAFLKLLNPADCNRWQNLSGQNKTDMFVDITTNALLKARLDIDYVVETQFEFMEHFKTYALIMGGNENAAKNIDKLTVNSLPFPGMKANHYYNFVCEAAKQNLLVDGSQQKVLSGIYEHLTFNYVFSETLLQKKIDMQLSQTQINGQKICNAAFLGSTGVMCLPSLICINSLNKNNQNYFQMNNDIQPIVKDLFELKTPDIFSKVITPTKELICESTKIANKLGVNKNLTEKCTANITKWHQLAVEALNLNKKAETKTLRELADEQNTFENQTKKRTLKS